MQTVPNGVSLSVSLFILPLLSHLYPLRSVLVSYRCWNKLPQSLWLNVKQTCYLTCQKLENRSAWTKINTLAQLHYPWRLWGESLALPFPASRGHLHCLAPGLSSHLQINNCNILTSASITASPSLALTKTLLFPLSLVRTFVITLGP